MDLPGRGNRRDFVGGLEGGGDGNRRYQVREGGRDRSRVQGEMTGIREYLGVMWTFTVAETSWNI